MLGDDADAVLSAVDDLNAGIAQVHQDAFKNVYDGLKAYLAEHDEPNELAGKSKIYVDSTMQKQMADMAIDKMTSAATMLIQQQPAHVQDITADIWMMGATIIADPMDICLKQMDLLETHMDDFIRLEDSWSTVKSSVSCAVAALRGIYNLMAINEPHPDGRTSRSASFAQATGGVFRRLSSAFATTSLAGPSPASSRQPSVAQSSANSSSRSNSIVPEYRTPNFLRNSVSSACPTSLPPNNVFFQHTPLSTIPPTPFSEESVNPFDTTDVPPVPTLPNAMTEQAVMTLV